MPIDARIPLDVKAPDVADPAQMAGKMMSLASMAQQRQLHGQQIEENKLDMEAKRRALDAQKAIAAAFQANTQVGPDGLLTVNHDGVQKHLVDNGYGPEAMKVDAQRRADLKAGYEQQEAKWKVDQARAARLGSLAGAVPRVDFASGDQAKISQQMPAAERGARDAMDTAIREGSIDKQHGEWLKQQPYSPEFQETLDAFQNRSIAAEKQHQNLRDEAKFAFEKTVGQSTIDHNTALVANEKAQLPGIEAKASEDTRRDLAGRLGAAADRGKDAYSAAYNSESLDDRKLFPHPDTFNPQSTPAAARNVGLNPHEYSTLAESQSTHAETAQYHQDTLDLRKKSENDLQGYRGEMLDLARKREERERTQTKNSQATDQRQARREYDQAGLAESKQNQLRRDLGQAIATGKVYVNRLGETIPMEKATAGSETAADLIGQMKNRYQQVTTDLKTTLNNKYDAMGRLGGTPTVPLEKTLQDLDAGDEKLFGPKVAPVAPAGAPSNSFKGTVAPVPASADPAPAKPVPPPAAAPPKADATKPAAATPKYTEADVRKRAADKHLSPDQIEAAVRAARQNKLIP